MATLDDLFDALHGLEHGEEREVKATSLRLPEHLHQAVLVATELGMDESFTAATSAALVTRLRAFAREQALAGHLTVFPDDHPALDAVVLRRVSGTDHPAAAAPDLVTPVARWYERRHPEWAVSGRIDEAVDLVLDHVELLSEVAPAAPTAN